MFYTETYGKIEPSTSTYRILASIVFPLLILTIFKYKGMLRYFIIDKVFIVIEGVETTTNNKHLRESREQWDKLKEGVKKRKLWSRFYHVPIVKFWTATIFYSAFLFLQGYY